MKPMDFVKNQNQITKKTTSSAVWIIASILFHLLILLLIMTYKFNMFDVEQPQGVRPDDKIVLYQPQPTVIQPAQQPIPAQPEPKKEESKKDPEPEQSSMKKIPIIVPGKQGLDEQNLDGVQHPTQYSKDQIDVTELNPITPQQQTPISDPQQSDQLDLKKETTQQQPLKNKPLLYQTSPLILPKANQFIASIPKQTTNQPLDSEQNSIEKMYQHVPKVTKEIPIKTISFKDLGLGKNNNISTYGNSAHMGIQGNSPDIPTGEELRYVTYLNQMANMIVNSMYANPQRNMLPKRTNESVVFHVKVDRTGNLLVTKILRPSKKEIVNIFILESVKTVGLFNPLPKFIKKDTFEINWQILM